MMNEEIPSGKKLDIIDRTVDLITGSLERRLGEWDYPDEDNRTFYSEDVYVAEIVDGKSIYLTGEMDEKTFSLENVDEIPVDDAKQLLDLFGKISPSRLHACDSKGKEIL